MRGRQLVTKGGVRIASCIFFQDIKSRKMVLKNFVKPPFLGCILLSQKGKMKCSCSRVCVPDEGSCSQPTRVDTLYPRSPSERYRRQWCQYHYYQREAIQISGSGCQVKEESPKGADKVPRTYDQKTFPLDGRMDLNISFGDKTMQTPVYIKMNAHDQLLLSEGVCRQLGIISYHPDVRAAKARKSPPFRTKQ